MVWKRSYTIILVILAAILAGWGIAELIYRKVKRNVYDLSTSLRGIGLIKEHEALRLRAYDDLNPKAIIKANDVIQGTLTIGYGHTGNVKPGDIITKQQADDMLQSDIANAEQLLRTWVQVPLTQSQFDALVSWTYNTGQISNTLKRLVNSRAPKKEFEKWFTSHYITSKGRRLPGLISRRQAEADLYWS